MRFQLSGTVTGLILVQELGQLKGIFSKTTCQARFTHPAPGLGRRLQLSLFKQEPGF